MHTPRPLLVSALVLCSAASSAQTPPSPLDLGGSRASAGRRSLTPGVTPDPLQAAFVSGGSIDVRALGLGDGCVGYVARRPDYIVHLRSAAPLLRFYVIAGVDTTLVVRAADRSWRCNDDSYGASNPTVDITDARPGRYDVWVGAYRAATIARGTLRVTTQGANHP